MNTIQTCLQSCLLNSIYLCIYALMAPVILYRRVFRGRSLGSFRERALGLAPINHRDQHCVWLHAVSVGEVNLLDTLLSELQTRYPESRFVISTTTATGMRLAKQKFPEHSTFYFPIDFSWAIRNALRRLKPDVVILTELEIWPNLISIASQCNVPVAVINGRLSENSFSGYQKVFRWVRPIFGKLDHVVAQNAEYAQRFVTLGCDRDRVSVAGSIKFDGAAVEPRNELVNELGASIHLAAGDVLLVAGSTQDPEELMACRTWAKLVQQYPQLRLVVVPRHPERGRKIQRQFAESGIETVLRSEMPGQATHAQTIHDCESIRRDQILISDTIGELTAWWSLATIAFVGGSFGDRGGQNMIEPAAAGAAVCFGPNTWNFKQIVRAMSAARIVSQLDSEKGLSRFVQQCLEDPSFAAGQGAAARQFVLDSQGALEATCNLLAGYFESEKDRDSSLSAIYRAA